MSEKLFDESYNVREVLDDLGERIALREKLIQTARQFEEKKREEKFALAARQFENLMADFLRLYHRFLTGSGLIVTTYTERSLISGPRLQL